MSISRFFKGLPHSGTRQTEYYKTVVEVQDFAHVSEPQSLNKLSFQLKKNDEVVQDGNTESMLWKIDELISYVSQYFTLKKGDVIFTGTPAGVGKVEENDVLTGVIENKEAFQIKIK